MRVAIPHWQGRVSPVFDVAASVLLVDLDHGAEIARRDVVLTDDTPVGRARRMAALGVRTLVCGAVSRPLELALLHSGIEVISQICGEVDQVLDAYKTGRMGQPIFCMPGCRGWQRRFRGGRKGGGR
jgi:predicted Fe-Mo cluster-binding NifX family protein